MGNSRNVLEGHETLLGRVDYERRSIVHLELAKNRSQVMRNSSKADMEPIGYLLVTQALADQFDDFTLSWGERRDLAFVGIGDLTPCENLLKHALSRGLLQPDSAIDDLTDGHWNLLDGPFALKDTFGSASQGAFKRF